MTTIVNSERRLIKCHTRQNETKPVVGLERTQCDNTIIMAVDGAKSKCSPFSVWDTGCRALGRVAFSRAVCYHRGLYDGRETSPCELCWCSAYCLALVNDLTVFGERILSPRHFSLRGRRQWLLSLNRKIRNNLIKFVLFCVFCLFLLCRLNEVLLLCCPYLKAFDHCWNIE